jgi:phosphonate transport system permease protein
MRAPSFLTNALYLLETNVRHSAILGYVGAGGIGLLLNEKISWREYGRVGAILVCLFVTVCCIEWLSHVLGRMIRGERNVPRRAKRVLWAAVLVCVVVCTAGIEAPDLAHTSKSVLAAMGDGLLHPGSAGCCSRRSASRWPAPASAHCLRHRWRF